MKPAQSYLNTQAYQVVPASGLAVAWPYVHSHWRTGQWQEGGVLMRSLETAAPSPPLSAHHPHKRGWGALWLGVLHCGEGFEKESQVPFAAPLPPAGWSQCSLSVLSYDQLATSGQTNTQDPTATVTPLWNRAFVPCGLRPNCVPGQICSAAVICGDEVLMDR